MAELLYPTLCRILLSLQLCYASSIHFNKDGTVEKLDDETYKGLQEILIARRKGSLGCDKNRSSLSDCHTKAVHAYNNFVREVEKGGAAIILPVQKDNEFCISPVCGNGCAQHKAMEVNIKKTDVDLFISLDAYYHGFGVCSPISEGSGANVTYKAGFAMRLELLDNEPNYYNDHPPFFWLDFSNAYRLCGLEYIHSGDRSKLKGKGRVINDYVLGLLQPKFMDSFTKLTAAIENQCMLIMVDSADTKELIRASEIRKDSQGQEYVRRALDIKDIMYRLGADGFMHKDLIGMQSLYDNDMEALEKRAAIFAERGCLRWDLKNITVAELCGYGVFEKIRKEMKSNLKRKNSSTHTKDILRTPVWFNILTDYGLFLEMADPNLALANKGEAIVSRYKNWLHDVDLADIAFERVTLDIREDDEGNCELHPGYYMLNTKTGNHFVIRSTPFRLSGDTAVTVKEKLQNNGTDKIFASDSTWTSIIAILGESLKNKDGAVILLKLDGPPNIDYSVDGFSEAKISVPPHKEETSNATHTFLIPESDNSGENAELPSEDHTVNRSNTENGLQRTEDCNSKHRSNSSQKSSSGLKQPDHLKDNADAQSNQDKSDTKTVIGNLYNGNDLNSKYLSIPMVVSYGGMLTSWTVATLLRRNNRKRAK